MKQDFILPAAVLIALLLHGLVLSAGIQQQSSLKQPPVRIALRLTAPVAPPVTEPRSSAVKPPPAWQPVVPPAAAPKPAEHKVPVEVAPRSKRPPVVAPPVSPSRHRAVADESPPPEPARVEPLPVTQPAPDLRPAAEPIARAQPARPASSSADENLLRDEYLAVISGLLRQHKAYPLLARRRGLEGTATLRLTIGAQGQVLDYRLEQSSGHRLLDQAVRDMLGQIRQFPPPPSLKAGGSLQCLVPVNFNLRTG